MGELLGDMEKTHTSELGTAIIIGALWRDGQRWGEKECLCGSPLSGGLMLQDLFSMGGTSLLYSYR